MTSKKINLYHKSSYIIFHRAAGRRCRTDKTQKYEQHFRRFNREETDDGAGRTIPDSVSAGAPGDQHYPDPAANTEGIQYCRPFHGDQHRHQGFRSHPVRRHHPAHHLRTDPAGAELAGKTGQV